MSIAAFLSFDSVSSQVKRHDAVRDGAAAHEDAQDQHSDPLPVGQARDFAAREGSHRDSKEWAGAAAMHAMKKRVAATDRTATRASGFTRLC